MNLMLLSFILLFFTSTMASPPVAIPVQEDYISVDRESVAKNIAKENAKILSQEVDQRMKLAREEAKKKDNELERLTTAKIQFDKLLADEQREQLTLAAKNEETRRDNEWRMRYPEAAQERDRVVREAKRQREEEKEHEHQRQLEKQHQETIDRMALEDTKAKNEVMLEGVRVRERKEQIRLASSVLAGVSVGLYLFSCY